MNSFSNQKCLLQFLSALGLLFSLNSCIQDSPQTAGGENFPNTFGSNLFENMNSLENWETEVAPPQFSPQNPSLPANPIAQVQGPAIYLPPPPKPILTDTSNRMYSTIFTDSMSPYLQIIKKTEKPGLITIDTTSIITHPGPDSGKIHAYSQYEFNKLTRRTLHKIYTDYDGDNLLLEGQSPSARILYQQIALLSTKREEETSLIGPGKDGNFLNTHDNSIHMYHRNTYIDTTLTHSYQILDADQDSILWDSTGKDFLLEIFENQYNPFNLLLGKPAEHTKYSRVQFNPGDTSKLQILAYEEKQKWPSGTERTSLLSNLQGQTPFSKGDTLLLTLKHTFPSREWKNDSLLSKTHSREVKLTLIPKLSNLPNLSNSSVQLLAATSYTQYTQGKYKSTELVLQAINRALNGKITGQLSASLINQDKQLIKIEALASADSLTGTYQVNSGKVIKFSLGR